MPRLDGRIAIVTGGAGGLGEATARRLVAEGAHVVIADKDTARANAVAKQIGGSVSAVAFDAADADSTQALIDGVVASHGRVDLLHNNHALTDPGTLSRDGAVAEADMEVWDATYATNLRGYVLSCKYVIPHMVAAGGGVIVNTSSDAALAGDLRFTAYACTKAAIITLSQYVATQYGKQGVRCVTVTPGTMMTDNMKKHLTPEETHILERHNMGPRNGKPEDIAALVAFLASDDASYLTGVNIPIDGGYAFHLPSVADVRAAVADSEV